MNLPVQNIKICTNHILLSSGKGSLDRMNKERACSPEILKIFALGAERI